MFVFLILALYGALHLAVVQKKLTQYAASVLSTQLKTKVSVAGVDIGFWDKVILDGVYVADKKGDTLCYIKQLGTKLTSLSYSTKQVKITSIFLHDARISLSKRDSLYNFQFLIDAFADTTTKKETAKSAWKINIQSIDIDNSHLSFCTGKKDSCTRAESHVVQFDNIDLHHFALSIKDIQIDSMLTVFQISNLSFVEQSGFRVKKISAQFYVNPQTIALTDLELQTNNSTLSAYYCNLQFDNTDAFDDFIRQVKFEVKLKESSVLASDVAYFVPEMQGNKNKLMFSGTFEGKVNDFKAKNIDFRFGKQTRFRGSLSVTGLPRVSETFFFCDITQCKTSYTDLNTIQLPPFNTGKTLLVPSQIRTLGKLNFKGNISGFVTDFVAYGTATSEAGIVYPDTKITIDTLRQSIDMSGRIRTSNFALGRMLESNNFGAVTMDVKLEGKIASSQMSHFKIDGTIESAECMQYKYSNVAVNGEFSDRKFEGFIHVNDPNIFLDFDGRCDFSKKTPELDFSAKIDHAWLGKLHLVPDDTMTMFAASINAKLMGNDIDNVVGSVLIDSLHFLNSKGKIHEPHISLNLEHNFQGREISLQSNAVDMNINGDFNFKSIGNDAFLFLKTHIPSLTWKRASGNEFVSKNIEFSVELKDIQPILSMFTSEIKVPKMVSIVGNFNPSISQLHFHANAPEVSFGKNKTKNISIYGETENSVFRVESSVDMRIFEKQFKGIRNVISFKNDSVCYESRWFAKDSNVYQGSLFAQGALSRLPGAKNPMLNLAFRETDITLSDSIWHISPFAIVVDSASVGLRDLTISKECDIFSLYGRFSNNPQDSLVLHVENMDFKNINRLIPDTTINFTGSLQGTVSVRDVLGQAIIHADVLGSNIFFNRKKVGNLSLKTMWNSEQENLTVSLFVQRGRTRLLNLEGSYFPKTRQIALDGELTDFDANTVVSILPSEVRNLHGIISGSVKVRGPLSAPEIYGAFDFSQISFMIDYLKMQYSFTGSCVVTKNKLSYRNVRVYDLEGNSAMSNGDIDFNTFPLVGLDVQFHPEHCMVLNTRYADNSLYFGKVYATGLIDIKGNPERARVAITAQTNEGSSFNIPISSESTIEESKFLTFVNKESKDSIILRKQREQVNLNGIELDFNLDITPDVDTKIIFDQKTGDILTANGAGNLHLTIDTKGMFTIYGDYTIAKGNYMLTLGNLMSKRFGITQGSRISWDGSPLNAMIDITAQYNTKASLTPLIMMSSDTSTKQSTRVPVACLLSLKDRISQPQVAFDVQLLGTANQQAKDVLQNMTDDERNKQFVSLLVLNSFFNSNQKTGSNSGAVATSEILSGQLNKWLSGINDKVNIGVNYRPGDAQSKNEVEVGMSTQLLNDRVTVNVNGYTELGQNSSGTATTRQTNQMLGDVNVEVKITKTGNFRVRGFSRPRPERFEEGIDNSQGVGLFYMREFDSFLDIFRRRSKKIARDSAK